MPPARTGTPAYAGTGQRLGGACTSPSYTPVDVGSAVYWAGYVGCSSDRPECCPRPATTVVPSDAQGPSARAQSYMGIAYPSPKDAAQLTLARCPDDYYSVSGSCCPTLVAPSSLPSAMPCGPSANVGAHPPRFQSGYFPFTRAVAGQTPCWSSADRATPVPTLVANVAGQPTDTIKPTAAIAGVICAVQYPVAPQPQPDSGLSAGAIAGIIISLATLLSGSGLVWFFIWRKGRAAARQGLQLQDSGGEATAMNVFMPEKGGLESNPIETTGSNSLLSMPPQASPPVSQQQYKEQPRTRLDSHQPPPPTGRAYVEEDLYHALLCGARVTSPTPPPQARSISEPPLDQQEVYSLHVLPGGVGGSASRLSATPTPPPQTWPASKPPRDQQESHSLDVEVGGNKINGSANHLPGTPTPPPQIWPASKRSPDEQECYSLDVVLGDVGGGNTIDHSSASGTAALLGASLVSGKSRSESPQAHGYGPAASPRATAIWPATSDSDPIATAKKGIPRRDS